MVQKDGPGLSHAVAGYCTRFIKISDPKHSLITF